MKLAKLARSILNDELSKLKITSADSNRPVVLTVSFSMSDIRSIDILTTNIYKLLRRAIDIEKAEFNLDVK